MTTQLNRDESRPQLQMVWPEHLLNTPPVVRLADGYSLRTYRPGDEPRFFRLMAWHSVHTPVSGVPFRGM